MAAKLTTVTRKGQITIPADVREALNIHTGDRVAVSVEGDRIQLQVVGSVVLRTAGSLAAAGPPLSAEELRRAAEDAIAADAIERHRL